MMRALALLCSSLALAGSSQPAAIALPIARSANVFFARTTINGAGPFWFTVDTGATLTVIDPTTAAQLNLTVRDTGEQRQVGLGEAATELKTTSGATLTLGGAPPFTPAPFYVVPVRANEGSFRHRIHGVLGTDYLRRFVVEFDYAASTVMLLPRPYRPPAGSVRVRITSDGNVLLAPAVLTLPDGDVEDARILIDTGSNQELLLNTPFVRAHTLRERFPATGNTASMGINGLTLSPLLRLKAIAFASATIASPHAALSMSQAGLAATADYDGLIGAALLKQFRVTIDYRAGEMWLERRDE